jgi:hypothetical protein
MAFFWGGGYKGWGWPFFGQRVGGYPFFSKTLGIRAILYTLGVQKAQKSLKRAF